MKRRDFFKATAIGGAAAVSAASACKTTIAKADDPMPKEQTAFALASPPVVQNPTSTGFTVAWAVSEGPATGWVEWGTTEALGQIAKPSKHGLVDLQQKILAVRIEGIQPGRDVFYRVASVPIRYQNAYKIIRGEPVVGPIHRLKLPSNLAKTCSLAMVNDTHQHAKTIAALAKRIESIAPDMLLWNGDFCNDWYSVDQIAKEILGPGAEPEQPASGGWASKQPLIAVMGNHDVRGPKARELTKAITPWPEEASDPKELLGAGLTAGKRCFALRHGPLAIIGLDTGEDKPDKHPVFAGMVQFEPYKKAQAKWLQSVLKREEIATAPFLLAACHIPLRGLPGHNDGQSLEGYAWYSGIGQALWANTLIEAGCQMVISGHTHAWRVDEPTKELPFWQLVGGGPRFKEATLTRFETTADRLTIIIEDLEQKELRRMELQPRKPNS